MAKTLIGTVSSNKPDKTIVVTVQTAKTHAMYKKQYTVSTKFMAHDERNEAEVGDVVAIVESKPLSARKRFVLDRIIKKPAIREMAVLPDEPVTEPDEKPVEEPKEESKA